MLKEEIEKLKSRDIELKENIDLVDKQQTEGRKVDLAEQDNQNRSFIAQFSDAFRQITFGKEVAKQ